MYFPWHLGIKRSSTEGMEIETEEDKTMKLNHFNNMSCLGQEFVVFKEMSLCGNSFVPNAIDSRVAEYEKIGSQCERLRLTREKDGNI